MGNVTGLDLQGGMYENVEMFCYLGDMLAARGGNTAAVTARIESAWKKFCDPLSSSPQGLPLED